MTDPHASVMDASQILRMAVTSWLLSAARKATSEELDRLGLADVRRGLGIGARSRGRAQIRAEAPRWAVQQ